MMPTIQAGDAFEDLILDFGRLLGARFPLPRTYIPHLYFDPTLGCALQYFYKKEFPNFRWWNEFVGFSTGEMRRNWSSSEWFRSDATATVREIVSPTANVENPGIMQRENMYLPEALSMRNRAKRLILGKFPGRPNGEFVFLGVYELDMEASMAYSTTNPYIIGDSGLRIEYPHCVWRRCSLDYEKPQQPAV